MSIVRTYLGLDLGTKRIGVAIGNDLTLHAREHSVIYTHQDGSMNWEDIEALLIDYRVYKVVIGMPYDTDGGEQMMTGYCRNFAKECTKRFGLEVEFVDERFTSNQAKRELKYNYTHKKADRGAVDKRSAELLLQQYFNDSF